MVCACVLDTGVDKSTSTHPAPADVRVSGPAARTPIEILRKRWLWIANHAEEAAKWDLNLISEEYQMESNMFNYEEIMKLPNFGIKKYQDSVYRGELTDDNRRFGWGVMVYRKNRVYEG